MKTSDLTISDIDMLQTLEELVPGSDTPEDKFLDFIDMDIDLELSCCSGFKAKSTFLPMLPYDAIDTFKVVATQQLKKLVKLNCKTKKWRGDSLSCKERVAIITFHSDDSIVIRQSDKGGNIVILSKEMYLKEGYR
ncbi:hypothetical protein NDU88_007936 [Pleurodeles waltl]|uniref:Uncharacterized protein n=1 Tax=Pleurodeles waltl TaxID=8319 RepID=A0AAV7VR44_PLEWA|nr:hypothetical protein NDU88_007936 [Pleurodeles waltl]